MVPASSEPAPSMRDMQEIRHGAGWTLWGKAPAGAKKSWTLEFFGRILGRAQRAGTPLPTRPVPRARWGPPPLDFDGLGASGCIRAGLRSLAGLY